MIGDYTLLEEVVTMHQASCNYCNFKTFQSGDVERVELSISVHIKAMHEEE